MKKDKTINFRIPENINVYINKIVDEDPKIKNKSEFGLKALTYFMAQRYQVYMGNEEMMNKQELNRLNTFVGSEHKEEVIQQIQEKPSKTGEILDEFELNFFMHGLEEKIDLSSELIYGIEDRVEFGQQEKEEKNVPLRHE